MNLLLYLSGEVRSNPQLILYVARCIVWELTVFNRRSEHVRDLRTSYISRSGIY